MIEESKYCSDLMKKHFNKELLMTKKDNEDFENSNECWICDNDYNDNDVKVRDHCHITRKYRGSAQRDININNKACAQYNLVLQKIRKMLFISSKKLFSFSRYSNFRNFFPSFLCFPDSQGQMEVE